eukprot:7167795-Pyramimonas_sp.AAC.1
MKGGFTNADMSWRRNVVATGLLQQGLLRALGRAASPAGARGAHGTALRLCTIMQHISNGTC